MDLAVFANGKTSIDPTVTTTSTFKWVGGDGTHLVAINESFNNLYIMFGGGQKTYVPANDRRLYKLTGIMAQADGIATYTVQSGIQNLNSVNQLIIEVYAPGEEMPEIYPTPLIRQLNVAQ